MEGLSCDRKHRPKKGWTVEGAISRKMLRSGLGKMTKQIFLLELVFLALSAWLTAWLSKNMTINITALLRSFRSIGSGMMAEDIAYKEGDETAYLCEKFNEMNHRLQLLWSRWQSIGRKRKRQNIMRLSRR